MQEFPSWIRMADQHWKKHLPRRYAELKKTGKLDEALQQAANQTYLEVSQLEESGYSPDEAFQMVREQYLLPRPEGEPEQMQGRSLTQEAIEATSQGLRSLQA